MRPASLGVIGVGRWGRNVVRTCTSLPDDIVLAAVASQNPRTADLVPPGCRIFGNWRSMLSESMLDGVVIATPPATHAEITMAAIESGIAALVEKPLTTNLAEAEAIERTATSRGIGVMVDHIHLYNPAFRTLIALAPTLGRLRRIEARAGNRGPYRDDTSVLWDWGPHDVAMILTLVDALPVSVTATRDACAVIEGHHAENIRIEMNFSDGCHARTVVGTLMDRQRRFAAMFEGGSLLYDDLAEAKLTLHPPGADPFHCQGRKVDHPVRSPLAQAMLDFAAAATGSPPDNSLALGVEVTRILAECASQMDGQ